jgi:hypothetical protein
MLSEELRRKWIFVFGEVAGRRSQGVTKVAALSAYTSKLPSNISTGSVQF